MGNLYILTHNWDKWLISLSRNRKTELHITFIDYQNSFWLICGEKIIDLTCESFHFQAKRETFISHICMLIACRFCETQSNSAQTQFTERPKPRLTRRPASLLRTQAFLGFRSSPLPRSVCHVWLSVGGSIKHGYAAVMDACHLQTWQPIRVQSQAPI